jgi:membrane associated rhomboid family serine protease|tara:strand:+ start:737 stop:1519 length:783 start_codon:yes stop_codon:yes gene_type:complete
MFGNILKNISPVVKNILIINILFFVAQLTFPIFMGGLSLYPFVSEGFEPWQLATHFFMHSPESIGHIFFNMFAVVIFGTQLERVWGPKKFLGYYIACAFGAAILHQIVIQIEISALKDYISNEQWYIVKENGYNIFNDLVYEKKRDTLYYINEYGLDLSGNDTLVPLIVKMNTAMLGASGAVFGLLAAFGYLFPNTELMLLFPPIPIKAKYFVIGYAALELYLGLSDNPSDNVAHFAHLGGGLIGIIIVLYWGKNRNSFF